MHATLASASYRPVSVCLSVCLSQVGVLLKRLKVWITSHHTNNAARYPKDCTLYAVSKKRPTFDLLWFDCNNFWQNVAEKVGNQTVLYFPTSPNWCFCTTCGNKKPGNCVFSLKCCMLFHQETRNAVQNITWSELNHPSLSKRSTGYNRQDLGREHSILLSVTRMLCVSQVRHSVSRCLKGGSCSSSSLE